MIQFELNSVFRSFPMRYIQPSAFSVVRDRRIEFYVGTLFTSDLSIDPEHRPQRFVSLRKHRADAILFDLIGHDKLLNVHCSTLCLTA